MKKIFILLAVACALQVKAQQRLVLFEEFTGENCNPCAATNPGLNVLMNSGTNPSKILMVKYQSPIPSAGPLYNQNKAHVDTRIQYYGINSAPNARMDGIVPPAGTHPGNLTQAHLDAATAIASPFTITVSATYNANYDSVIATINITAVSAFAPANASLKLQAGLIESLHFKTPPGTNGEKDFENVIRIMYPGAGGTAIQNSWIVGNTQTYTLSGPIPSFVNKSNAPFVAVWIQNDNDKKIAQAAKSAPLPGVPLDVASTAISAGPRMSCTNGPSSNITPSVTIKNTGTVALTSASIYYKVNNDPWQNYAWTGSLSANSATTITLPAVTVAATGLHTIVDSLDKPNGAADQNPVNNASDSQFVLQSTVNATLPANNSFESANATANNWILFDGNANGFNWGLYRNTGYGANGTRTAAMHANYGFASGETNYIIVPTSAAKSLAFSVAYAQINANSSDALDVVYSTNCGQTWTSIWQKKGAELATAPMESANVFQPSSSEWIKHTVDLTSVPNNALVALQATAGSGNALWIDEFYLTNSPAAINEANDLIASLHVFPNPASGYTSISLTPNQPLQAKIDLVDALGRVVMVIATENLNKGAQQFTVNTSKLASGLYTVRIQTNQSVTTRQLSIVN